MSVKCLLKYKATFTGLKDWNIDICGFTVLPVSPLPTSLSHALLQVFFRKQGSGPFPAGAYVGLSLCSYSLHHCGRNRKTDINGQSQVKGRQISVLSPSGYLLSWVRVSVHDFWERGKPRALSGMLTVSCFLPFNLRVPGPQDGE